MHALLTTAVCACIGCMVAVMCVVCVSPARELRMCSSHSLMRVRAPAAGAAARLLLLPQGSPQQLLQLSQLGCLQQFCFDSLVAEAPESAVVLDNAVLRWGPCCAVVCNTQGAGRWQNW